MSIKVIETKLNDVYIIEPTVHYDDRGYFLETYNYADMIKAGIVTNFVQDNHSLSSKGVLRGMHFQKQHPQAKLIKITNGEVLDVVVDYRRTSSTFGQYISILLSEENKKQLYIPTGCAHGFLVLSETAEFSYKCSDFYYPNDQGGFIWDDPDINIAWPITQDMNIILSDKDQKLPRFKECNF